MKPSDRFYISLFLTHFQFPPPLSRLPPLLVSFLFLIKSVGDNSATCWPCCMYLFEANERTHWTEARVPLEDMAAWWGPSPCSSQKPTCLVWNRKLAIVPTFSENPSQISNFLSTSSWQCLVAVPLQGTRNGVGRYSSRCGETPYTVRGKLRKRCEAEAENTRFHRPHAQPKAFPFL